MVNLSGKMTSILKWWEGLPRDGDLPRISEIDPFALRPWLGDLGIVETVGESIRFRVRLAGVNLRSLGGMDMTGRFLDEIYPPPVRTIATEPYRLCLSERRPIHDRMVEHARPHYQIDRLLLPFGRNVERILVQILRTEDPPMAAPAPQMMQKTVDTLSTVL